jgi:hypothetical protein
VHEELAEGSLELVLVGSASGLRDVEQSVSHLTGVPPAHGDHDAQQRGLLEGVEPTDRPQVDERQRSVGTDEDVAGMGVGMKYALGHDLMQDGPQQSPRELGAIETMTGDERARVP